MAAAESGTDDAWLCISMFHEFLAAHRDLILERARARIASREAPVATTAELEHGLPVFMDQLVDLCEKFFVRLTIRPHPAVERDALRLEPIF